MAEGNSERFDIKAVHDECMEALHESDDVKMKNYIAAFQEFYKFFNLMSTVFGFVSSDVKQKLDILIEYAENEKTSASFTTVKTMMQYEKDAELLDKKDYVSGSRTLLRLHRGLDFIRVFMRELGELQSTDKTSHICQESYDKTLAQYHPWIIRKGAKVAMYTLPNKEYLLRRVCGDSDHEIQKAIDVLPKMLESADEVYDRIQNLYTFYDLHSLP